jgi:DNA mismatch repair protein MutL
MTRIRILPENLSNKIAAGEVVERPASVVKELVENAIDAGSSRVIVDIEQGGRKVIRVSDNGQGMGRDDALLCLERYATSKINREPDLFAIHTLGFRGEALPSIASVSRFTLDTREADADVGTRIEVAGGRLNKVADMGAPAGTMVTVAGLFYNTPARRKFLKSINTEMGHIADTIASMALCRPTVQFRLSHNDRIVKSWAPAADPTDRVADVLGAAIRKELHTVDRSSEDIQISGWVASPRMNRSTARGIYLFVNGRWVKDRVIQHALFAGYSGRLMKGQYPVAVLFLSVPFDQVDVNVHPTKHEIRFVHQKIVHNTVRDAVADALRQSDPTRWNAPDFRVAGPSRRPTGVSEPRDDYGLPPTKEKPVSRSIDRNPNEPEIRGPAPGGNFPRQAPKHPQPAHGPGVGRGPESLPSAVSIHPPTQTVDKDPAARNGRSTRQVPLWKKRFFADLTLIGQYRGTYIICESDTGLMLIDQHAAHERIVFEQLKHRSGQRRPASQRLLMPETIDLGFREAQILERLAPELDRYGLEIEPFGGNTFVVKAIPTLLDSGDIPALVLQLVEKTVEIGVGAELESIMDGCLMVMACHHAIRANQQLTDAQIKAMLGQLDACDNPSHCPHGRPIWIRWTVREIEKQFQRIV